MPARGSQGWRRIGSWFNLAQKMFPALTLFVILTLSVIIIGAAAVALRITGLADESTRFQTRSAFTGTGFTTSESEVIINQSVRR